MNCGRQKKLYLLLHLLHSTVIAVEFIFLQLQSMQVALKTMTGAQKEILKSRVFGKIAHLHNTTSFLFLFLLCDFLYSPAVSAVDGVAGYDGELQKLKRSLRKAKTAFSTQDRERLLAGAKSPGISVYFLLRFFFYLLL